MESIMSYVLDVVLLLIIYLLGFARGRNHRKDFDQNQIDSSLDPFEDSTTSETNVIKINIEHIGTMFYAYDAKTKVFLGQGTTRQELFDAIRLQHPHNNLSMTRENLKQIGWSDE